MKAKIFKMTLPVFTLTLAVFGAFAFKSAENKALLAPETGWLMIPGDPCRIDVQCDTSPGPVCTGVFGGVEYEARGKDHPTAPCDKLLFKVN